MSARPEPALLPPLPPLPDGARVLLAFSGGLDSTVLLHALAVARAPGLTAVHVHHGLQPAADRWAAHAAEIGAALGVPMIVCRAQIAAADAAGPEAAARTARYALLRQQMQPDDVLVTAHHRDDQTETVLLRLFRGVGVHGLAAMRPLTAFPPGRLWRPLLDQSRDALLAYATRHGLKWIEDPHNDDPRYARSWLRQQLLPAMRGRFGQLDDSVARTARLAAEATELLDERAAEDHAVAAIGAALSIRALLALSPARRHNLIRWWLTQQQFRAPFAATLARIDRELLAAPADAEPLIHWPGCELRRHRDRLLAMPPLPPVPPAGDWGCWRDGDACALPAGCGAVQAASPPPSPIRIRQIAAGEVIRLAGDRHRKACRKLFQAQGIPGWVRPRLPLLDAGDGRVCIAAIGATDEWQQWVDRSGWQGYWQHGLAGVPARLALTAAPLGRDCP